MLRKLLTLLLIIAGAQSIVLAQQSPAVKPVFRDSITIRVHPKYDSVSKTHMFFFGKNYRKEWAEPVKLPVIRISEVYGGLTPEKEGGGMQSKSLRLKDKSGKEWVLRSVEKTPEKLLPENLQNTFVVDWIDDALSGQHPYSALVVPPLAAAANVPYANPVIGVVADDAALGEFRKVFANTVCLLEEREPIGESDNTVKMLDKLIKNYDNSFDGEAFLRARLLDLLIGDWDRHEDQWRWAETKKGDETMYVGVPRDRDQVFHLEHGVFPYLAALSFLDPALGNFTPNIPSVEYGIFKTRFINPYPDFQMGYEQWMRVVNQFVAAETDSVLEAGLKRLPVETYRLRHDELFNKLKARRNNIPAAMAEYYLFIYKIVDLRATDKDEIITINGVDKDLKVTINKTNKEGQAKDTVFSLTYNANITDEIRLYTEGGDDHVIINNTTSPIKLRVIGGKGNKVYEAGKSTNKVKIYDTPKAKFIGDIDQFKKHISADTLNTRFVQTNLYDIFMPLATAKLNADDGFFLGLGFKFTRNQGFRRQPYTSLQQVMISHSFATTAFSIKYDGEWISATGKADLIVSGIINAPNNTINFFGLGNETPLVKSPDYRTYYRTRFNIYQVDPALRWRFGPGTTFSVGPSIQYYRFDEDGNVGRFINNTSQIGSYDSLTIDQNKGHAGLVLNYINNKKNRGILPTKGYLLTVNLIGYKGLNKYSESFAQIRPEITFYQKINSSGSIVLSDRIGGGVSVGKPAFYQSMFLGGEGNLLGYLKNRFAGKHMLYNNIQARIKLANIASYILPGQIGIGGFYDVGRVWVDGEDSNKWHDGYGGGIYFVPASLTVFQVLLGHSTEGWYPYISLNFRI